MELLLLCYSVCLSSRRRDEGSVSAVSTLLFGRRSTLHCLPRAERQRQRKGGMPAGLAYVAHLHSTRFDFQARKYRDKISFWMFVTFPV